VPGTRWAGLDSAFMGLPGIALLAITLGGKMHDRASSGALWIPCSGPISSAHLAQTGMPAETRSPERGREEQGWAPTLCSWPGHPVGPQSMALPEAHLWERRVWPWLWFWLWQDHTRAKALVPVRSNGASCEGRPDSPHVLRRASCAGVLTRHRTDRAVERISGERVVRLRSSQFSQVHPRHTASSALPCSPTTALAILFSAHIGRPLRCMGRRWHSAAPVGLSCALPSLFVRCSRHPHHPLLTSRLCPCSGGLAGAG